MEKNSHLYMPEDHMDSLYKSKNKLVKYVHMKRLKKILQFLPKNQNLKVLDAGCGEGHLVELLSNNLKDNVYYGVDITDVAIEKAKARCPSAKILKGSISSLQFPDKFFDVVICTEVIEHIYDYEKVIVELKRVLKDEGFLIITFPNETNWTISRFLLGRRPIKVPDHVNSFNHKKMKKTVDLDVIEKFNVPFNSFFVFSLGGVIKFKKSKNF